MELPMNALRTPGLIAVLALSATVAFGCSASASNGSIPAAVLDSKAGETGLQTAVLSGGCFWGMQGVYQHVKGVKQVLSGYAGGAKDTAEYETVSTGTTGHAESVKITFDPKEVSYGQILRIFFSVAHDPTELNYQGPDSGTQYRSEIWVANAEQAAIARAYVAQLDKASVYPAKIVTRVDPLKGFYAAEGYHQDYLFNHPDQPYIAYNDIPKVEALKKTYPTLWRQKPVLVASAS
ncbi:MAG: peptide-methionine (S)-S-oxide reductase MsrA [Proteobacteria bacterium]|nr:peptide-methionine (S)-S-oxide reductase MsrA [Pseudomonadota bacterium]